MWNACGVLTRLAIQQEVSRSSPADFWKARSRAFRLIHILKEGKS